MTSESVPVDVRLSAVDGLLGRPFPERDGWPGADGWWGGPGYLLAVLWESRDFWEDRSEEVTEAVEREVERELRVLVERLTSRWGAPEAVELDAYAEYDGPGDGPLPFLSGVAGSMEVWQPPGSGRWLALAVGQADPEFPVQLLAAVGVVAAPRR
ncbi:hypothetical protein LG634_02925 [Streptomyces bambusae]|uniref:hypothetical protein n=1 Tax=Streptomyces bambusae TaxID=1550616 RepID=UPI001CFC770C|nr:hypothetical protein [Streptomyces bambusae]MCB5163797.1 hypothetical protein [Streptomyces bambusae]